METPEIQKTAPSTIVGAISKTSMNGPAIISFFIAIFPYLLRFGRSRIESAQSVSVGEAAIYTYISICSAFFAIVVGVIALALRRYANHRGRGWAVAGILIGAIELCAFSILGCFMSQHK
jgi:hypothetical protein